MVKRGLNNWPLLLENGGDGGVVNEGWRGEGSPPGEVGGANVYKLIDGYRQIESIDR